jgi:hypothetical protein
VLKHHPRLAFKTELRPRWAAAAAAMPAGRARWLTRYAAFPLLVKRDQPDVGDPKIVMAMGTDFAALSLRPAGR